jgi:2'-5' RNA ligase
MRTFIAINLSREIKDYLCRLQEKLKLAQADVKWVRPENIHLTLKFLGEIDDKTKENVTKLMEDISKDKTPFYLNIASIGAFPRITSPRVIWVGIDKGDVKVKEIAKELEEKLSGIGIPVEDKPFSSHITIGRTRSSKNRKALVNNLIALKDTAKEEIPELYVDKITLFKSTLAPKGPIYEVLKEAPLGAIT